MRGVGGPCAATRGCPTCGEDLLDVRLVRDGHRRLLEDNVVKWEGVLEVPHEGKLVHESLLVGEGGDAILCKICPALNLVRDRIELKRSCGGDGTRKFIDRGGRCAKDAT